MCCDKVDSQKPACCIAQSVRHLLAVVPPLLPPPLLRRHIWFLKDALSKNLIRVLTINTSNESLFAHMLACTIPDLISWRTSCAVPSSIFDRWNNKGPHGRGADAAGSRTLTFCSAFGVCRRLSRRGSEDSPPTEIRPFRFDGALVQKQASFFIDRLISLWMSHIPLNLSLCRRYCGWKKEMGACSSWPSVTPTVSCRQFSRDLISYFCVRVCVCVHSGLASTFHRFTHCHTDSDSSWTQSPGIFPHCPSAALHSSLSPTRHHVFSCLVCFLLRLLASHSPPVIFCPPIGFGGTSSCVHAIFLGWMYACSSCSGFSFKCILTGYRKCPLWTLSSWKMRRQPETSLRELPSCSLALTCCISSHEGRVSF